MSAYKYVGSELELFEKAVNYKKYFGALLKRYLVGEVLEVGAGIGGTTAILRNVRQSRWVCLEPDPKLKEQLRENVGSSACEIRTGTITSVPAGERFDAIFYSDVLEHIEDDAGELQLASQHLKRKGKLIVVAPAHNWLLTPFDKAIGHFRRYTRARLKKISPENLRLEKCVYLDSVGLLASLTNRLLLKKDMPTQKQLWFWDFFLVRASRVLDPLTLRRVGKSVLAVWSR